jgi:hypothetical protein
MRHATPEGIAAARRLAQSPGLSASQQIARAAWTLERLTADIHERDTAWLLKNAEAYEASAQGLADAALHAGNGKVIFSLLEMAGLQALRARVYAARAAERGAR